jgi:hypothetical protein
MSDVNYRLEALRALTLFRDMRHDMDDAFWSSLVDTHIPWYRELRAENRPDDDHQWEDLCWEINETCLMHGYPEICVGVKERWEAEDSNG